MSHHQLLFEKKFMDNMDNGYGCQGTSERAGANISLDPKQAIKYKENQIDEIYELHTEGNRMKLTREQILETLRIWNQAWDAHDLDRVMELFHEDILFENWTGGRANGKQALRQAWQGWFEKHGDFRFNEEELFADDVEQKALYRWELEWPSLEAGHEGQLEKRRGVDVIHFQDGKIINKLTYSKTTVEIDGKRIRLSPEKNTAQTGIQG